MNISVIKQYSNLFDCGIYIRIIKIKYLQNDEGL